MEKKTETEYIAGKGEEPKGNPENSEEQFSIREFDQLSDRQLEDR